MNARLQVGSQDVVVDLSRPRSLALELDFDAPQPQHFGAPAATSRPYAVTGFSGSVTTGASCNCERISVIPHCNGTHTEGVGHLTRERFDVYRIVPAGLVPALLVSVAPVAARDSHETSDPTPQADDLLVTGSALQSCWPGQPAFTPQALIIRTGAQGAFLSREAAHAIVERGIRHLVIDLPSIDREHDAGRLTAHRILFGLSPGSHSLTEATRTDTTVTELARIPNDLADGLYLLELQIPAWRGDAVPSRPLLYALQEA